MRKNRQIVVAMSDGEIEHLREMHRIGHYVEVEAWVEVEVSRGVFERREESVRVIIGPWTQRGMRKDDPDSVAARA